MRSTVPRSEPAAACDWGTHAEGTCRLVLGFAGLRESPAVSPEQAAGRKGGGSSSGAFRGAARSIEKSTEQGGSTVTTSTNFSSVRTSSQRFVDAQTVCSTSTQCHRPRPVGDAFHRRRRGHGYRSVRVVADVNHTLVRIRAQGAAASLGIELHEPPSEAASYAESVDRYSSWARCSGSKVSIRRPECHGACRR